MIIDNAIGNGVKHNMHQIILQTSENPIHSYTYICVNIA